MDQRKRQHVRQQSQNRIHIELGPRRRKLYRSLNENKNPGKLVSIGHSNSSWIFLFSYFASRIISTAPAENAQCVFYFVQSCVSRGSDILCKDNKLLIVRNPQEQQKATHVASKCDAFLRRGLSTIRSLLSLQIYLGNFFNIRCDNIPINVPHIIPENISTGKYMNTLMLDTINAAVSNWPRL